MEGITIISNVGTCTEVMAIYIRERKQLKYIPIVRVNSISQHIYTLQYNFQSGNPGGDRWYRNISRCTGKM